MIRRMRERVTISLDQQAAARVRRCGAGLRGGVSAYLERLIREDELREATSAAVRWYAARPDYALDAEAEQVAALDGAV
jgi:hypothetical protein